MPIMSHTVAANFIPFNPDARGPNSPADAILAEIAAAEKSLRQIAADHGTTLPALALWLESPQAQDRMAEFSTGLAAATRLAALAHTHSAVAALDELITDYRAERIASASATTAAPPRPAPDSSDPSTLRERMLAERRRGNIIRAATILLRLTRLSGAAPSSRQRTHTAAPKKHDPRPHEPMPHEPMPRAPMHHAPMPFAPHTAPTAPASAPSDFPHSTSNIPLIPLAQRVYDVLSEGIPADEAAGLRESLIDATEDDVRAMVDSIRNVYGDDYIPELNDIVPANRRTPPALPDPPDPLNPNRSPRSGNPRASPAGLLAAAGSSGPAP
jgi:hypothetical protein